MNDLKWIEDTQYLSSTKYEYNYDTSMDWFYTPKRTAEVLAIFEHERHGLVIRFKEIKNGIVKRKWVRYDKFTQDISEGLWTPITS